MFTVRTIRSGGARVEAAEFDLEPQLPQGRTVCNLFAEFLAQRPAEFRETLPFLSKLEIELQWAAAARGSAFASFFHEGKTLGMAILLSGSDAESDSQMLEAINVSIFGPMLGTAVEIEERPGVLLFEMDDQPELIPTLQLLITALASVYFRAVNAITNASTV